MTNLIQLSTSPEEHVSNGHNHDALARGYIEALARGETPERPDVGKWEPLCTILDDTVKGDASAVQNALKASGIHKRYPGLKELLNPSLAHSSASKGQIEVTKDEQMYPPLPDSVKLSDEISRGACPLMEVYMNYSKEVSPRGYEYFHENGFLFVLSTIASRRVAIPFGTKQYTPLMTALVADTTLYVKSYTAERSVGVLNAAGLKWMLGDDETTPQRIITDMKGIMPLDYGKLPIDQQEDIKRSLAMSAQRGWFYDEMGDFIRDIVRGTGTMANFKGLLLKMDNCFPSYSYSTQKRGREMIENPYLALLGTMTVDDMRVNGKTGSNLWTNGFWARIAFVCPPPGTYSNAPIPRQYIPIPSQLPSELRQWHDALGIPTLEIIPILDEKEKIVDYQPNRGELPEHTCIFGNGVFDAFDRYDMALREMLARMQISAFNGPYGRLPFKAMRIAALFASLENAHRINNAIIEMRHWAKAQEIAERWRASLHELHRQIHTEPANDMQSLDDRIVAQVKKLKSKNDGKLPTARDVAKSMGMNKKDVEPYINSLARDGVLKESVGRQSKIYDIA